MSSSLDSVLTRRRQMHNNQRRVNNNHNSNDVWYDALNARRS